MKWSRLLGFLAIIVLFFALAVPTYDKVWNNIKLGLDLQGGFDVLYEVQPSLKGEAPTAEGIASVIRAIDQRVDKGGVTEPFIQKEGENRIRVQIAGQFNQTEAKNLIVRSAKLEFKDMEGKVLATGEDIQSNAKYVTDPNSNQPQVSIEFKDPELFKRITEQNLGKQVAIILDDVPLQAPEVRVIIHDGKAVIGQDTAEKAIEMADYLNAGALPYPLKEISSTSVAPTLGTEALNMTVQAGLAAFALIFVFMVIYYRIPGLIAMIALAMYAYLLFAVVNFVGITLTLPGLAALILGIGMAVDVNIIAIERMKDEFRQGKSLLSAVIMGQKRSMPTIIDANVTSIIAGFLMYYFGTGPIKSFAVAHIISVLATFVTAVMISRLMMQLLVRSNLIRNPWWYGAPKSIPKGGAAK